MAEPTLMPHEHLEREIQRVPRRGLRGPEGPAIVVPDLYSIAHADQTCRAGTRVTTESWLEYGSSPTDQYGSVRFGIWRNRDPERELRDI